MGPHLTSMEPLKAIANADSPQIVTNVFADPRPASTDPSPPIVDGSALMGSPQATTNIPTRYHLASADITQLLILSPNDIGHSPAGLLLSTRVRLSMCVASLKFLFFCYLFPLVQTWL